MLNRCEFIGNVGRDPEVRSLQNGDKVANFSIAVTERWKNRETGERKENTTWVPVVVWGGLVTVVENYVRKGTKLFIAGKFTVRKWQDQNGNDRYSTEVVLRGGGGELQMLDGPSSDGDQRRGVEHAPASQPAATDDLKDDLPF